MSTSIFWGPLVLGVTGTALLAQEPQPATDSALPVADAWNRVAAEFRARCQTAGVVGAGLMFVRGDDIVGFEPVGFADRAGDRPVDRDTIWHWASITKTFTGIATMQLRDRGLLALDQPILDYVPELREVHDPFEAVGSITIRHLLSHSAGFGAATWPWGGDRPWHPYEPARFEQLVAMMPYTELRFAPGSRYSYSNPGIVFVGRAVEQVTGEDYEVYVEKNLLRPLGMSRAYFDRTPYHLQRFRSHGYAVRDGSIEDLGADFDTGVTVSNGGLNAPLPDMARYLAFLLGAVPEDSDAAGILARDSLAAMWQPILPTREDGTEHIGLTFFLRQREGQHFVTHTGTQHGFLTFFYVHPASGTGVLGAFNTDSATELREDIRALCMDELSAPLAPR
jgi:CubicO group peptidase (beta-lactamase class C family)